MLAKDKSNNTILCYTRVLAIMKRSGLFMRKTSRINDYRFITTFSSICYEIIMMQIIILNRVGLKVFDEINSCYLGNTYFNFYQDKVMISHLPHKCKK